MGSGEWEMGDQEVPIPIPHSPLPTPYSDSHHLNVDFPVVRAVEFGKENFLPGPEFQPAVNDRNGNAMADHDSAKVRVGVPAIAIGKQ